MRYVGGGTYIHGVPARDLTDDEAEKFGDIIAEQESLIGQSLYEPIKPKTKTSKSKAKPAEENE